MSEVVGVIGVVGFAVTLVAAWVTWRSYKAGSQLKTRVDEVIDLIEKQRKALAATESSLREAQRLARQHRLADDIDRIAAILRTLVGTAAHQRFSHLFVNEVLDEPQPLGPATGEMTVEVFNVLHPMMARIEHIDLPETRELYDACRPFPWVSQEAARRLDDLFRRALDEMELAVRARREELGIARA